MQRWFRGRRRETSFSGVNNCRWNEPCQINVVLHKVCRTRLFDRNLVKFNQSSAGILGHDWTILNWRVSAKNNVSTVNTYTSGAVIDSGNGSMWDNVLLPEISISTV